MGSESSAGNRAPSSLRRGRYAPQKIVSARERIFFRDLAKLAAPRKTRAFLVEKLGCDDSTAKRYLTSRTRVSSEAVYAVLADIFARIE